MPDAMLAAACSLLLLVPLYYWVRYIYSDKIRRLRDLPTGRPTLPLLGHLHYLMFTRGGPQEALINIFKWVGSLQFGLFVAWMGPSPFVIINEPEDVEIVLNNSVALEKGSDYKLLKYGLGEGLMTAKVPIWKVTRHHMMSLFNPHNLEYMVPMFNKTSRQLVQQISKGGHGPVDVIDHLMDFSIRNVVCFMFGSQAEDELDSNMVNRFKKSVKLGTHISGARFVKPWLRWDSVFYLLYKKEIQFLLNSVYSLPPSALKGIEEFDNLQKIEDSLEFKKKESLTPQDGEKYPLSLLEIYKTIREQHPMKREDLINEFNTLLVTGLDTPLAVSNCLLALAAHPHIQTKLYNEIVEEVGKEEGTVTSADVTKLKYMDCVLSETLRRFPIIPFIMRTNESPMKLGDYTLPPGSNITINVLGIHHDPRLFPDPDKFDPERFTTEQINQRHKYSFIPFSGGARGCIGRHYAWLSMKIALVHVLREYKVSTTADINNIKFSFDIVMAPKEGHLITFEKRKK